MTLRVLSHSIFSSLLFVINLAADDFPRFEFLADKAELITPTLIVAPDLSDQRFGHGFLLLAKVENGRVQSVETLKADGEIASRAADVLKSWQFSGQTSGRFLLLCRLEEPLRTAVYAVDSLDNKPSLRVKAMPSYPHSLRAVISWKAAVEVVVDQHGTPVSADVLSSSSIDFVDNARAAALLCRFETGLRGGAPVCYKTQVEIAFDATR